MNLDECRRILGVPAGATPEEIHQAYLDLVRVWHPDRFESDARLRQVAQENLYQINSAYTALRNGRLSEEPAEPAQTSAPAANDGPPESSRVPPFRRPRRSFSPTPMLRKAAYAALTVVAAAALARVAPLLRAPVMDAQVLASSGFQPRILSPMRIIDPATEVREAADTLTEWARGDALDLWKPARPRAGEPPRVVPVAIPKTRGPVENRSTNRERSTALATEPAPPTGTELLPTGRRPGAGGLSLDNHTDLEAIVKLVSGRSVTLRAIYIAPHDSATIRSIGVGIYDVYIDLGRDLDAGRLRFQNECQATDPLGPFQFVEISSENGVSGDHYQVILNPAAAHSQF